MSTPPSEEPRLPDTEKQAEADAPDLDRAYRAKDRPRLPEDERDERIADPDE